MKRFQLCLLAVFMLLVSNRVAASDPAQLPDGQQKETQVGTGGSDTVNKAAAPIGAPTGGQKTKEVERPENADSVKTLPAQDHTKSGTPGAPGLDTKNTKKDTQIRENPSQGAPIVEGDAKDQKTGGNPSESSPATEGDTKETKEKDEHSKSAPATKDGASDPKTGGNPSEGAPVVSGTTAAPAAEGKPTEGNSGSASTSTHIPTDPAKGADSQASVKAGVLSLILSIGTVLAVFA